MIYLDSALPTSQEGMEKALGDYFQQVRTMQDVTLNGMLGASLQSCDYENRTLVLRVETKPWMENPSDVVHGGMAAAMLDVAMGTLCRYFCGGGMTPTVSMQVNYLRPAPIHAAVCLRGQLHKMGETLCYTTAEAWVEGREDEPVWTASGVYYARDAKKRENE